MDILTVMFLAMCVGLMIGCVWLGVNAYLAPRKKEQVTGINQPEQVSDGHTEEGCTGTLQVLSVGSSNPKVSGKILWCDKCQTMSTYKGD